MSSRTFFFILTTFYQRIRGAVIALLQIAVNFIEFEIYFLTI